MEQDNELSESQQVALAVQALARAFLELGEVVPELREMHETDPSMSTEYWYERYCLLVTQHVKKMADSCGFETELVLGLFVPPAEDGKYGRPMLHAWLELPDGTIVDPTSSQMGSPEPAMIIEPADVMYRHYRMRGWWREGDGERAPWDRD
jgi:hypothetical protein